MFSRKISLVDAAKAHPVGVSYRKSNLYTAHKLYKAQTQFTDNLSSPLISVLALYRCN